MIAKVLRRAISLSRVTIIIPINILGHDWGSIVGWSIVMRSNIFVKSFISICGGDEFPQASVYSKLTYNNKPHYISSFQNPHLSASVLDKDLDLSLIHI